MLSVFNATECRRERQSFCWLICATFFALATSGWAQTEVPEVEYQVRTRSNDPTSIVTSLHESTGKQVVLYYDRHLTLKALNVTYKGEDELVSGLKKAGLEVTVLPEGIALAPIAYEHEAYNYSFWDSPLRMLRLRSLSADQRPTEDGFSFETPTLCSVYDFTHITDMELKAHEMFHTMQLLVVGNDLEWELFGNVLAAALGAKFEHGRATSWLVQDPVAIGRRVSLFQDRFPQPFGNHPVDHVDYYQHAITAHLFRTHFSPEEIEALLKAKPREVRFEVPVKVNSRLYQLAIGAFTGMQPYITDTFPRLAQDIHTLEVFVSSYRWSSIKAVNHQGGGYIF